MPFFMWPCLGPEATGETPHFFSEKYLESWYHMIKT